MGTPLPRSSPLDQGVDPAAVLAFLDAVEGRVDIEMHSLMVVRHGHVVAEGWWAPYSAERRQLLYSLSKSFTAVAAGLAQAEGLLDLDDPVVSHFPELDTDEIPAASRAITVRHVASMASGHTRDMLDEAVALDANDLVRGFLLTPPERAPGSVFAYNQPCTYALAGVVQRRAGMPLTAYLRPRLLDPLGIDEVGWHAWPAGHEVGFTGLHARTEDVAKLGLLLLQRGRWNDRQLIPPQWVDEATTTQVENPDGGDPDWRQGYGFQLWMARHGYRGDGAYGQFCVVLPDHQTVVATTAATEVMQAVLDAMWTHLLPGLGAPGRTEDETELCRRLDELQLAPCSAVGRPPEPSAWQESPFTVVRDGAGPQQSGLTRVEVGSDDGSLRVVLTEPDNALTVEVGRAEWCVSEPVDARGGTVPVAASGGWDGRVLRVAVIFLETPHRLDLTLALPGRTAVAAWRHPPLGGDRIEYLHSP